MMYVPPFWCGVIATLLIEVIIIAVYVFYVTKEGKNEDGKDNYNKSDKQSISKN